MKLLLILTLFNYLLTSCGAQSNKFESLFDHFISLIPDRHYNDPTSFRKDYDFIVVGAGSGGSVIANRLSEIDDWNVLLLEAGKPETPITDIPVSAAMVQITGFNWGYKSVPNQKSCLLLEGGVCNLPQGRALGGTSVINFLVYTRGNRQDYDEWAELGAHGWSYDEVLPYFQVRACFTSLNLGG